MENKPIVTCHGDQNLFSKLHPAVMQSLPKEPVEWRRSYGRPVRTVHVEATFVPFNPEILPNEEEWTLLGRPFFHTYWMDCDVETYKTSVKEEISDWLTMLRGRGITDWLIMVLVNEESKVKAKLLRTSLYDKVKSDFCSKQPDRCIVMMEPFRKDQKSVESWEAMVVRLRQLLLQSYNTNLSQFEEHMRAERERRTERDWNFCQYFMLQEELAFMFEMLRLFEDALVQYDELDALFTQFVLNHAVGETATWLSSFQNVQCITWDGLCLTQPINIDKRHLIKHNHASLLDFRNYLFSRQCTLLFLLGRPWEVAQRSIPFLHNCMKEIEILEISLPKGAESCWVFLSCLEVLTTCERFSSNQVDSYSLYTANLREYARKKAHHVGVVCGLMPDSTQIDQQAGLAAQLQTGLTGDSEPLTRLKEALISQDAFQKYYLELSELAMGTYKHIGRIRSARLIGKDLATFYMKLGDPQTAEGFLTDALKTYKGEGWEMLADHTRLEIAKCNKILGNQQKYIRTCSHIAASPVLSVDDRKHYQQELELVNLASETTVDTFITRCRPMIFVNDISVTHEDFILGSEQHVKLVIQVNLLHTLHCDEISCSLIMSPVDTDHKATFHSSQSSQSLDFEDEEDIDLDLATERQLQWRHKRQASISSLSSATGLDFYSHISHVVKHAPKTVGVQVYLEHKPDQTVSACGLVYPSNKLKRTDSGPHVLGEEKPNKQDHSVALKAHNIYLKPGLNAVILKGELEEKGHYNPSQLCVRTGKLEMLKMLDGRQCSFNVLFDHPYIENCTTEEIYCEMARNVRLILHSGSREFSVDTELTITGSSGVTLGLAGAEGEMGESVVVNLPALGRYMTHELNVCVYAQHHTHHQQDVEHKIMFDCSQFNETVECALKFTSPLKITNKLHTSGKRKFVQLVVSCEHGLKFELRNHSLTTETEDVELLALNKKEQVLPIAGDHSASYMWELQCGLAETSPILPCKFLINMLPVKTSQEEQPTDWTHTFSLQNYKTLYTVKCWMAPLKEHDVCAVGTSCQLMLRVTRVDEQPLPEPAILLYELESDSKLWAFSGKTAGVFHIEKKYETSIEMVPLIAGHLALPAITLQHYTPATHAEDQVSVENGELSKEEETEEDLTNAELQPFHPGQIYNSSTGSQIHIMPASSDIEIDVTSVDLPPAIEVTE